MKREEKYRHVMKKQVDKISKQMKKGTFAGEYVRLTTEMFR